jgi:chemotaxis protein methyltransferase CheR
MSKPTDKEAVKNKVTKENYKFLSDLLLKMTGLELGEEKEYLLESRLAETWKALGLGSLNDFAYHLRMNKDRALEKKVGDLMTTNETLFFRDGSPFETFQKELLLKMFDEKKREKTIAIWSAACSTGQEPYSIAICMLESGLNWSDWKISILATDISDSVLRRAQEGRYSSYELNRGMPAALRDKYFTKDGAAFVAKPCLKQWVKFEEMNLTSLRYNMGPFDYIFLRNVMIYFDLATKSKILDEARKVIAPNGILFLGSTESILGLTKKFVRHENAVSSIYRSA